MKKDIKNVGITTNTSHRRRERRIAVRNSIDIDVSKYIAAISR